MGKELAMNNYSLIIRENKSYYCNCYLKADFKDDAIKQANEIMNRFPEKRFTGEIIEGTKTYTKAIAWFN